MKRDFNWHVTALVFGIFILAGCTQSDNRTASKPTQQFASQQAASQQAYVVQCGIDCKQAAALVEQLGGSVSKRYANVPALSIRLPEASRSALASASGVGKISKDRTIALPKPRHLVSLGKGTLQTLSRTAIGITRPQNYSFNNQMTGADTLHAAGITGSGVIVAVIDSGVANSANVEVLAGRVIGGEDLVGGDDEPSATSGLNDGHGTMVGSMIAADGELIAANDSDFAQSVKAHSPESIFPLSGSNSESVIPMQGSAPNATLYALKVFGVNEDGAPDSRIIEAMDRVLTLKKNYDSGMPSVPVAGDGSEENPYIYDSLNIQVVNLSLGGASLFAGNELGDVTVREMLAKGIVVAVSAGNDGNAAMTVGSPGSSVASIAVGATNSVAHERILRDMQFGLGIGELYRPTDQLQIAYFSSRGPTPDGRAGVNVMANGVGAFVQGADGDISFVSGTSFSSPTVAGSAALLREAFPNSSAAAIRDALIHSANIALIQEDHDRAINQGEGFIDLVKAQAFLQDGRSSDEIPALPKIGNRYADVERNIRELDLRPVRFRRGEFSQRVKLRPGQTEHFFIRTNLSTDQIQVSLSDIRAELPIEQQNTLFADGIALFVVDAPTSYADVLVDDLLYRDASFTVDQPQSGLLRVAVMGDWVNVGEIEATLNLTQSERKLSKPFASGKIRDAEAKVFTVKVNSRTTQLNMELTWNGDWGAYPTHDLDMIIYDPAGTEFIDGATLDTPERVSFDQPMAGKWQVLVTGFMLYGDEDQYTLRITDQDGRVLEKSNNGR